MTKRIALVDCETEHVLLSTTFASVPGDEFVLTHVVGQVALAAQQPDRAGQLNAVSPSAKKRTGVGFGIHGDEHYIERTIILSGDRAYARGDRLQQLSLQRKALFYHRDALARLDPQLVDC